MFDPHPLKTIWTEPRATVRRIIEIDPSYGVVVLACLAGIGDSLDRASSRNTGDTLATPAIIAIALVVGPLGGLFTLWLSSHLIRWTGGWLGGRGIRSHIKTAIAWGSVPSAFALILWVPELIFFGSEMFTEDMPSLDENPGALIGLLSFAAAETILGILSAVLLCHGVAEAQGYASAWRGLGNILLSGLVIILPILVFVFGLMAIP